MRDIACLSYWFPILAKTGVPVPKTRIIRHNGEDLCYLLEGRKPDNFETLINKIHEASLELGGYPVFLRTGQGSGKHQWKDTCYLESSARMARNVAALVEWSHMVDFIGLPTDVWVVRELLPLTTYFTAFKGFPVNKERRYFIKDGTVVCRHPYWPEGAVEEGRPSDNDWRLKLAALNAETNEEIKHLTAQATRIAEHFEGAWSLDFAQNQNGTWHAIDMAPAAHSFHWPGCPHIIEFGAQS